MATRAKSRGHTGRERSSFSVFVKLFTDERFPLKNITTDMKISELKQYMEFATGIPVHMQRLSYLDEGDLLDNTDIKSNDIVPGATLQLRVWPMWKELIEAAASNDMEWVFKLGVTQPTDFRTPHSDYMTRRARKAWLEERAFLALFIAAHRGHEALVRKLIDSGADVNACTPLGRTPLHVAAAQGRGNIVDLLLEKGADIDAEDEEGQNALTIAAKFGHKTCERHLFLFRWQQRAKRTKPTQERERFAHQFFDSAFPVWMNGRQCQLYFTNILPPGEFEGTRFDSPRKKPHGEETDGDEEDEDGQTDAGKLPAIKDRRYRAYSGASRSGKKRTDTYDEWLGRKRAAEQRIIDVKRREEDKKQQEEDDSVSESERKRQENEKSESYETWLAQKEAEKKTQTLRTADPTSSERRMSKTEGYLRSYLRALDQRKRGNVFFKYEDWLDEREERVLGVRRANTAHVH